MPKLTPEQAAQKWRERASAATEDYRKGIERVTESPTAKAAQSAEKMLQKIMEAIQSGRWAAALNAVSLADWKAAATTKGVARMAAGVAAGESKQRAYYARVFPFLESLQAEIAAMPNLTIEDSIQRAGHFMRRMNEFKLQGG